jgi:hypothetical protein
MKTMKCGRNIQRSSNHPTPCSPSVAAPTDEHQLSAARTYLTALQPWLTDADAALPFRAEFLLFDRVDVVREGTETKGAHVRLSPETERFFRAWLRKQGVDAATT